MQTATVTGQCLRESVFDWDSPVGCESAPARLARYAYIYRGPGSRHWLAQPCDILWSDDSHDGRLDVVLACGCQTHVSRDCIVPRPT